MLIVDTNLNFLFVSTTIIRSIIMLSWSHGYVNILLQVHGFRINECSSFCF